MDSYPHGAGSKDARDELFLNDFLTSEPLAIDTVNERGLAGHPKSSTGGPFEIIFETGMECNLACTYCYQGSDHPARSVGENPWSGRLDAALAIVEDRGAKDLTLSFIGGEPLLRPVVVFECVERGRVFAQRHGMRYITGVSTNGTLLSTEIVSAFTQIAIPLTLEDDHDHFRPNRSGRGSYRVIERKLRALREAFNNGGAELLLRYNVHRGNVSQFLDFLEMVDALRIINCIVRPHPVNNYDLDNYTPTVTRDEYLEIFDSAERWNMERGHAPKSLPKPSYGTCLGHGGRRIKLRADGSIALCNMDWTKRELVTPHEIPREWQLVLEQARPQPAPGCLECSDLPICGGPKLCTGTDLDGLSSPCGQLPFDLHKQMRLVAEYAARGRGNT